jgi:hypothetical protein
MSALQGQGHKGKNANELTSSDTLTDRGRAPAFYECPVEVGAL